MIKKTFLALLVGISTTSFADSIEPSELAKRLEYLQQSAENLQKGVKEKKVSDMKFKVRLVMLTTDLKRASDSLQLTKTLKALQKAMHREAEEHRTLADFLPTSVTRNLDPDKKKALTEAVEVYFSGQKEDEKKAKMQKLYEAHDLTDDSLVAKGVKVVQELSNTDNLEDALFLCKLISEHYVTRANASEKEATTTTHTDLTTEETNLGKMLPVLETNCKELEKNLSEMA